MIDQGVQLVSELFLDATDSGVFVEGLNKAGYFSSSRLFQKRLQAYREVSWDYKTAMILGITELCLSRGVSQEEIENAYTKFCDSLEEKGPELSRFREHVSSRIEGYQAALDKGKLGAFGEAVIHDLLAEETKEQSDAMICFLQLYVGFQEHASLALKG